MSLIIINDTFYEKKKVETILQFCFENNIEEIPRFCYSENLSIAGNCRMCLVEDIKSLKPIIACTTLITNVSTLYTNSIKVKKAREGILEFLLINHPLDCPICCQGGECDLQDLTLVFGSDKGRFYENKRSVNNKFLNFIIKTSMNRCIHCTRCVRYSIEIIGINNLGILGRGNKIEIGTYITNFFKTNLSGNLIDLCPVGALTSKTYSFISRPWELWNIVSINVFDIFLPEIRIDMRGGELLRILPRNNSIINEEWITDDIRFCFDSLKIQRLLTPLLIFKSLCIIVKKSWRQIFNFIKLFFINTLLWLKNNFFKFICFNSYIGPVIDLITIYNLKFFLNLHGFYFVNNTNRFKKFNLNTSSQVFNNIDFSKLDSYENFVICGIDLRIYVPILFLKIKLLIIKKKKYIYYWGSLLNNSNIKMLGNTFLSFKNFIEGKHWLCFKYGNNISYATLFIINNKLEEFFNIYLNSIKLNNKIHILNLHFSISTIQQTLLGILDSTHSQNISYYPCSISYLIDCDFNNMFITNQVKNLVIYQGTNANININYCNIILPTYSFLEESLYFINILGKIKKTQSGIFVKYNSLKSNTSVINILSFYLSGKINNKNIVGIVDKYPSLIIMMDSNCSNSVCIELKNYISCFHLLYYFQNRYLFSSFNINSWKEHNFLKKSKIVSLLYKTNKYFW
jgi:NADH-quinone oxidoreductase chain G